MTPSGLALRQKRPGATSNVVCSKPLDAVVANPSPVDLRLRQGVTNDISYTRLWYKYISKLDAATGQAKVNAMLCR